MDSKEHILWIDILKAMACICVLLGHVINGLIKADMLVPNLVRHFNTYIYLFHVPCFFFASGYLYAYKKIRTWKEYGRFLLKKAVEIGTPYLVCSILYIALSALFRSEMNNGTLYQYDMMRYLWKMPIAQYWYLYALLELLIIIPIFELIIKDISKIYLWIGLALLAFYGKSEMLQMSYIIEYGVVFYLGVVWNNFKIEKIEHNLVKYLNYSWGIYIVGGMMLYFVYINVCKSTLFCPQISSILKHVVVLLLVLIMVRCSCLIDRSTTLLKTFLLWLSNYSFYIYLFHTWFSGTARVLLFRAGIMNCWIHIFIGMTTGLFGSIIVARCIRRVLMFQILFEPKTALNRARKEKMRA